MHKTISKTLATVFLLFAYQYSSAQVGVGTTTPRGALDVASSTQGIAPPQVALTDITVQAPVVNPAGGVIPNGTMVWNTNTSGTIPNNVSPGLYYWLTNRWVSVAGSPGGLDWSIIGNGGIDGGTTGVTGTPATQGANFIGTYDVTNFDIRTQGLHAARVSSLGEFFIGGLETILPGDLMNGISEGNTLFPWAINGYTDQDGAGVYGQVTGGTTNYAGVQGEYNGTSNIGAGVRGLINNDTAGNSFDEPIAGVKGDGAITAASEGAYKFGVAARGGYTRRSGAVFGDDFGFGRAALGYFANNGNDYGVYAFGTTRANGGAGGRSASSYIDTSIGMGVHGGVVGAWVKGYEYGTITKGNRFANYSAGKNITNESFVVLDKKNDGRRSVSYATTSMSVDLQHKGSGKLTNGSSYVAFGKNYSEIIDEKKPIIVTITPIGETNGVHIVSVDKYGFKVKENRNGQSNVAFNWIAISEKKATQEEFPQELLRSDFDTKINGLMHNEDLDGGLGIWSENNVVKFGEDVPDNPLKIEKMKQILEAKRKGKRTPKRDYLRTKQIHK